MPAILDKLLRIGEGKILRQLETISAAVNAIEDDFVAMSDAELQGMTDELKKRFADGEDLDDLMPEAFATVREAAKRVIGQRHYDVQIMGGAALHMGNIAEMKTGEGKTLVATLPAYLNALTGRGVHVVTVNDYLAKYHAEWMGRVHHFLGPHDRRDPAGDAPGRAPRGLRLRHHLRHQQRARLRLPPRQHGELDRGLRPARPPLRHRRRGRLDPRRRGADPADHQRPDAGRGQVVRRVRQDREEPGPRRGLRGRREEAHHLGARAGHHQGRGPPRHREPLRGGQHPADLLPQQLHQGQGAVPQRQGVRRHRRRGPHRRRAHRPDAGRPPLQRRPAPGDRGQGGGDRPRGVPDARDGHAPELLPALREAVRDDRHGDDRGLGVRQDLRPRRGADPDQPPDGPQGPGRPRLPDRGGQVRRRGRGHRRAARQGPADPGGHRVGREVRAPVQQAQEARRRAQRAQREGARRRGQDRRDGGPPGRGHRGHQHGRPRHRHHARRLGGVPRRRRAAQEGPRAGRRDRRRVRGGLARDPGAGQGPGRGRARRGPRPRRPLRRRHRAARVPAHRQPAARPVRPSGRPG